MRNILIILVICIFAYSCNTSKQVAKSDDTISITKQDTVIIANEELEYEGLEHNNAYRFSHIKDRPE